MPPESQNQTPVTSEPSSAPNSTPSQASGVSKKVVVGLIAAGLIFAVLVGTIIFLLLNREGGSTNGGSANNSSQTNDDEDVAVEQAKVVAKLPSTDPNIDVELLQPRKVGNTLVVNYNLVNKLDQNDSVTAFRAGTYTIQFGVNQAGTNGGTAEPYAVSDSDGQKYALARDDRNQPLASGDVDGPSNMEIGQKISGYVTLTLPPSGSTISVFLGNMSAFTGIKVSY